MNKFGQESGQPCPRDRVASPSTTRTRLSALPGRGPGKTAPASPRTVQDEMAMKASAHTLGAAVVADKGWFTIFSELIKARLTFLVLLTTLVGFYVGFRGAMDYLLLFHTLFGTGLVASGAAALNQFLERQHDARMRRTEDRPLPSERLSPDTEIGRAHV